ncbi:DCC1-like thiol-disulfide oxidoreductase family protein [Bacillus sp. B15-48]|uniref:thiol-disulfide oxidoreductase DCC family protein n=1 Tax=Bacillus sp. B15-48 TaxID=1548601 RepID=UPI0019400E48|nr:DCC1-like thiol-disulfide oxidoreductase family protein [Bacillus sp. B15-48]MBM4762780.1 DUF393 domain-containing protein [Bacillus sp. B15-48]
MKRIILFDGECLFCDYSVQFIIKRDIHAFYKFASLQSKIGKQIRRDYKIPENLDSLVLIEDQSYYIKSTAALRICRKLTGIWKLFYALIFIPTPIRNRIYDIVAKNRYKWFGKKGNCELPTPEVRGRFL